MVDLKRVELSQGELEYRDVGQGAAGTALVFVHGILVDHRLWDGVVAELSSRHRCIVPLLPLGAHHLPLRDTAERSPAAIASMVGELIEALGLERVCLIGNDTGSLLCQIVASNHGRRIERLVLTNGDALEVCPPFLFKYLRWVTRVPGLFGVLTRSMTWFPVLCRLPIAYGAVTEARLPTRLLSSWISPCASDARIRRDFALFMRAASPAVSLEVSRALGKVTQPVRLVWAERDSFFSLDLAGRLMKCFGGEVHLVRIPSSGAFVPLDRPREVAREIERHTAGEPQERSPRP